MIRITPPRPASRTCTDLSRRAADRGGPRRAGAQWLDANWEVAVTRRSHALLAMSGSSRSRAFAGFTPQSGISTRCAAWQALPSGGSRRAAARITSGRDPAGRSRFAAPRSRVRSGEGWLCRYERGGKINETLACSRGSFVGGDRGTGDERARPIAGWDASSMRSAQVP